MSNSKIRVEKDSSPERRIFYVDIGNLPTSEAKKLVKFMKAISKKFLKRGETTPSLKASEKPPKTP